MSYPLPDSVRLSPNVWPGNSLPVQPGDPTQFAPMGFCMNVPTIIRPWDTLESAVAAGGYYGAQPHSFHPLHGSPRTDACGGAIYFDSGESRESLLAAFEVMGVRMRTDWRDFAVFHTESKEPLKDGYIAHCRIMPWSTLEHLYHADLALVEGCSTPQLCSVQDVLYGFVQAQEQHWGTGMSGKLSGCMGGDGDWAKESLCFGFMVENAYHLILRIWSRAQLVTK